MTRFSAIAIFLCALAVPAAAQTVQTNPAGTEKGSFSILFENDIFFNTDHDYTNGVELAYTTAPNDTPGWVETLAHDVPFFTKDGDVRTRYALGQDIFTPNNLEAANPPLSQRPYAGFLYGSLGVVADPACIWTSFS